MRALLCLVVLVALAQGAEIRNDPVVVNGLINSVVTRLQDLLSNAVKGIRDLLLTLLDSLTNVINQALGTVSGLVTNSLDLVNGLVEDARKVGKQVESCVSRVEKLKNVKDKVKQKVNKCKQSLELSLNLINGGIGDAESSGSSFVSKVVESLRQCWNSGNVVSCLSSVISSATNTIQDTIETIGQLSQVAVEITSEATFCVNNAVSSGKNETVKIVNDVKKCLSSI